MSVRHRQKRGHTGSLPHEPGTASFSERTRIMEDYGIIQYISNYGMPAILCIVLIVLLERERKQREQDTKETRATLDSLKEVIKDNTNLLQRILDLWK